MEPLAASLAALADVQLVELPGHGGTPLVDADNFTIPFFAGVIAEAAAARGWTGHHAPLCFGYSMGGYAALWLAATVPTALAGVVTLGTKFAWTPDAAAHASARLSPLLLREKVPAFAATLEARHASCGGWELVLMRTAALLTALGEAPLLSPERFAAVTCPAHLLVGERDDTVTFDETARVAALMPHATAAQLDGVPHPIERVPTDRVITAILPLLRS